MSDANFEPYWRGRAADCSARERRMLGGFRASVTLIFSLLVPFAFAERASIDQGQYILNAGGCISCHTSESGPDLAGGVPFETPFEPPHSTNITPDVETGIGGWSREEFSNAMRKGTLPDGSHLYPVCPYTSYTLMSDDDIELLYDYLMSILPAREQTVPVSPEWEARRWDLMEPYYDSLSDREIADVLTYIRNAWTNSSGEVTEEQVRRQR